MPTPLASKRVGLAILCISMLTGALLWTNRLNVAIFALQALLERQGMRPVAMQVTRLDLSGFHLHDVALYGGAIQASDIDVTFSLAHLAAGTIDRVVIDSLLTKLNATGDAIAIGDANLPFSSSAQSPRPTSWRVDAVRLNDAHLSIATPSGTFEAGFSTDIAADLAIDGGTIQSTGLALDLSVAPLGGLHIEAPTLALTTATDGGIALSFEKLAVRSKDFPWIATAMTGALTWNDGKLTAKLDSGLLASTRSPPTIVPLAVTATAAVSGPIVTFSLHANDVQKIIDVTASGQHDRASAAGTVAISSHPIVFQTGGTQPKTLFPAASQLPPVAGTISVSGGVSWRRAGLFPALILHLADLALAVQGADLSKIQGDITLSGFSPLTTAGGQTIHAVITGAGLPQTDAALVFQLLPTQTLHVQTLDLAIAGGRLSMSPFDLDPQNPTVETQISVRAVDLAKLLELIGVGGLDGTGRLDGALQMRAAQGKITVTDGHLATAGPGVLHLHADALPRTITDAGEQLGLVVQALADFHYETLTIDLVANTSGSEQVALVLKGNNPSLLEGRAFNLNIALAANFDRLIDIALKSMQAAQALLRQAAGSIQK